MKKMLFIAVSSILFLTACKTVKHIPAYDYLAGLDLRPYAEKGFLITPNAYGGDHTSIYLIDYVLMPEANYTEIVKNEGKFTESTSEGWVLERIDLARAVDSIYNKSVELGANAITGFKVEPHVDEYLGIYNPVIVKGLRITGMAIKRVD